MPCALKPRCVCGGHAYVRTRAVPMRTGHAAVSSCRTYASSRGTSSGDFVVLAAGQKTRREFRSFEEARAYVHTLGLKSAKEWQAWSASGVRPHDIPGHPEQTYKSSGWLSYPDFLGYQIGNVAGEFRTFEDARTYVHTLGLKSRKEWNAWSTSGARPHDIPSTPNRTYKSSGWTSYPDFLGYQIGKVTGEFRTFEDARTYVHTLGLKSQKEWRAWNASGARPHDIPSHPDQKYASSGWTSLGDFLGYAVGEEARVIQRTNFRSFEDARTYVHTLGLKSTKEWRAWRASGKRPHDIPSAPEQTYKSSGWLSYPDFLGYQIGKVAGEYRSFEEARAYVHTLGLKSQKEWDAWSASGARPHDIPSNPDTYYKSSGWLSYGDFLGYQIGNVAGEYCSFEDARAYVHTLGLKSQKEWDAWSASGARPYDIPGDPYTYYASSGWMSYGDFLGYDIGKKARS
ncbi:hypothetical protein RI054_05g25730 [Pseudoscourfieldia marina]